MGDTKIEWTDKTWSPLRARVRADAAAIARAKGYTSLVQIAGRMAGRVGPHCERVSHGCENCYSKTGNARCLPANGTGLTFDRRSRDLVEPFVDEKILMQPLKWRGAKKIFVENQSDLFGEWHTDEMIDRVLAVGALCPQHTLQLLTKRPEYALEYFTRGGSERWGRVFNRVRFLPNVWVGVSVEDQATAEARSEILRKIPAAVRFISQEPQLSAINWTPEMLCGISWVIIGGESGPGARPFDIQWARDTLRQCREAGVAVFVKQLGRVPFCSVQSISLESFSPIKDRKGGHMSEWPSDLRVREFPEVAA
ncbi:MAG: DUF5131 family protein [Acidobacteriota bacterium]